ncbi:ScbA/BarX family gamma-butyrolactone biosynthesis protein [Micromonospora sp. WMMD730]|uniref:ScbA/BarX family gamma-butyrolactone biosynthesis protein n=1 Tax=Micromonospora sp. WMMD730 TaxID=3404128 RepID=UPI003B92F9D4
MKLSYDSTVPRQLVHRSAVAEVLLTDWQQTGATTFVLAAQWPRGHSFYGVRDGQFDPLLAAETIRQAGILLAHVGFEVPQSCFFLMQRLAFGCVPEQLHAADEPFDLVLTVEVGAVLRRACTIGGMRIDVTLRHGGDLVGEGSGWLRCVSPATYERLRWGGQARAVGPPPVVTPADPASVGRQHPADVVVGPADPQGTRQLRVPLHHPVLFDHPLDHVPGMLAFEAMRQAALAATGRPGALVVGADATFPAFLELDRECTLVVRSVTAAPDRQLVNLHFIQDGAVAVHGEVALPTERFSRR